MNATMKRERKKGTRREKKTSFVALKAQYVVVFM